MKVEWARYRCFAYGSWEPELIQLVSKTVKSGFTIVDIGAHIGYYSLLFSRLVGADRTRNCVRAGAQEFRVSLRKHKTEQLHKC